MPAVEVQSQPSRPVGKFYEEVREAISAQWKTSNCKGLICSKDSANSGGDDMEEAD